MMSKLNPTEIQDINRRIAAGTYKHEEEAPKKPRKKPVVRREKPEFTEVANDE